MRLRSYIWMLTLSIPAAPRLRLTFRKAVHIRSGVIRPVNECALILANCRSFPAELPETNDVRRVAAKPWRVFLSGRRLMRVRLASAVYRRKAAGANCPHGFVTPKRIATVPPFACAGYSGEAAIPKCPHQEGTGTPPRNQNHFAVGL